MGAEEDGASAEETEKRAARSGTPAPAPHQAGEPHCAGAELAASEEGASGRWARMRGAGGVMAAAGGCCVLGRLCG